MKNRKLAGCSDVFLFTLKQNLKSKSFIITTLIFCIVAIISMPIAQLLDKGDTKINTPSFDKVMIIDETGYLSNDFKVLEDINKSYKDMNFVYEDSSKGQIIADMEEGLLEKEILLYLRHEIDSMSFYMEIYYGGKTDIKESDVKAFSNAMEEYFNKMLPTVLNISDEELNVINAPVINTVSLYDIEGNVIVEKDPINMIEYNMMLAMMMIIIFLNQFISGTVATSIVTEKSTKVIEYLLITLNPIAILVGKILASIALIIIEFTAVAVSYVISMYINGTVISNEGGMKVPNMIKGITESGILSNLTVPTVVIALLTIIFGVIFFATTGAMAGATVSRIEDMAEGLKFQSLLTIVGAYLGMGYIITLLGGGGSDIFKYIVVIVPISSIFVLPVFVISGKVSIMLALISLGVLIISVVMVAIFASKVYEGLIYYNGNKIRLKDIIMLSKTNKTSVRGNQI